MRKLTADQVPKLSEEFAEILLKKPEGPPLRWFGMEFNQVSGLLYFLQRYPKDCAPLTSSQVSSEEIIRENYFLSSGGIEFFWDGTQLTPPDDFAEGLRHCLARPNIRFVFTLLSMKLPSSEGGSMHANAILYDTRSREVEIFEPQLQESSDRDTYTSKNFYDPMYSAVADAFADVLGHAVTLFTPYEFCPSGPQLKSVRRLQVQDPRGFCAAWSLWWINARLENANRTTQLSRAMLIVSALDQFRDIKNVTEFIRNYASFIIQQRDELVREAIGEFNLNGDVDRFLQEVATKSARFNWLNTKLVALRAKKRLTKADTARLAEYEAEMTQVTREMGKTLALDDVTLRTYVLLGYEKRLREYTS